MKLLTACTVLALMCGAASARDITATTLPNEWLGPWCLVEDRSENNTLIYSRENKCSKGSSLVFHTNGYKAQDGTDGPTAVCRFTGINRVKWDGEHWLRLRTRCRIEGFPYVASENVRINESGSLIAVKIAVKIGEKK